MRAFIVALSATLMVSGFADAQVQNARQRRQLLEQVVERLLENGRVQAGLNDEQFNRYSEIARRSFANRNEIQRHERVLWQALEGQMRPGVAADEDSVVVLMDFLLAAPERRMRAMQAEQGEYAEFLTPVQRAQLMLTHRRFEANIQQILRRRLPNRPE